MRKGFIFLMMCVFLTWQSPAKSAIDFDINEFAQEASKLSFDVETAYVTKYLFRGFDILDDKGAVQPSITVNFGETGLWFNFWSSFALDGGSTSGEVKRNDLDELDWVLGYDKEINEHLSISAGYILYQFPNTGSGDEVNEFFGSFTSSSLPFSPTISVYYDFPVKSRGPASGWFYEASVSHTLEFLCPVTQKKHAFDLGVLVGANDGVYGVPTGGFAVTHVTFDVSTTIDCKYFEVTPGFTYQVSTNSAVNDEDESVFTISLSKSF